MLQLYRFDRVVKFDADAAILLQILLYFELHVRASVRLRLPLL